MSCSASVDVAPRDITFCPEAGKSREKGECSVRERGKLTSVERVREREESGSKGEEGRQNNCWSDELVEGGALLYTEGPYTRHQTTQFDVLL